MNQKQNMKQKISHRNVVLNVGAALLSTSIAAYSFAADDYDRIKRDINVMIGIVKSSFEESDECRKCRIRISGHYLAEQGAVFNVNPGTNYQYVYAPDVDFDSVTHIPDMVQEIIEDVRININGNDITTWEWNSNTDWEEAHEAREEVRELRHEQRELSREMRELEILAIHADEEEMKRLEAKEKDLEAQLLELEAKQERIEATVSKHEAEKEREREARKEKRLEQKRKEFEKMEDIVLNTFCDYSSTMRSLPEDEKISVIVDRNDDASNVYVFDQSDLMDCDSRETDVRKSALYYAF